MADELKVSRSTPTITVSHIGHSIRFYQTLGFAVEKQYLNDKGDLRAAMLRAGSAWLGLAQDDFAQGSERVKGVALRFFFELGEPVIPQLTEKLEAAGLTIRPPFRLPWGAVAIALTDPDGFAITICE